MNIGIYIYEYAEPIDFTGPYEVFATANKYAANYDAQFLPYLISESGDAVTARHGYQVVPHRSIHNHPELDVLIVSGGVYAHEMKNMRAINWIQEQASKVKIVASVCNGVFLLAQAKLLSDRRVTAHEQHLDDLAQQFPDVKLVKNTRWVEDGEIITSAGMSAGIDMSLQLVSRLSKLELAKKTADQLDFKWRSKHVVAY
ncbi:putative Type 1 glutamine amidotransferase (GATase1)-like [Vibrio nigripulchritudo MADA3029]|uniref:Type 1 glutamine amidotransferase (GATase1)-like n=3 Tax=Vibrio nigripulchritudo TaxID=28173 RepID=A0AAV2VTA3_9VIBR|nr:MULTISPECIES: DJ-1/PfpI family protein [Vibrio]EGU50925.1 DJ-1/PfpI family protein [Vibrio nigripulchritudo ATCC 27043]UAB72496.1 DJ-1/PfpI family protein [Vibrio sp. SCSIO 43132]CCN32817.1 putative Type 1 glutamine amidotransferase (GATase1)-like [Vibrio nigripulchritudo AM115]CCN41260.1 putative Type 1 glutamine amidotransferase (GATase1)-like [Vibrio nigripulchritudo FTn2]CCN48560.1 putative Type 1 glutamine amidotransferase (GATase1)-like [Vibrio nigripulchritudo MADA3020]